MTRVLERQQYASDQRRSVKRWRLLLAAYAWRKGVGDHRKAELDHLRLEALLPRLLVRDGLLEPRHEALVVVREVSVVAVDVFLGNGREQGERAYGLVNVPEHEFVQRHQGILRVQHVVVIEQKVQGLKCQDSHGLPRAGDPLPGLIEHDDDEDSGPVEIREVEAEPWLHLVRHQHASHEPAGHHIAPLHEDTKIDQAVVMVPAIGSKDRNGVSNAGVLCSGSTK